MEGKSVVNRKRVKGTFHGVIILLFMSLLIFQALLLGEKAEGNTEVKSEEKVSFELTVKDNQISLNAKDASLSEIIKEIGQEMEIEIVDNIPDEEKINIEFDRLSLKEALEKLSASYGYVMDSEKGEKITKIIILPKGEESRIQEIESTIPVKHEPFKFEFDPSEFMEAGE